MTPELLDARIKLAAEEIRDYSLMKAGAERACAVGQGACITFTTALIVLVLFSGGLWSALLPLIFGVLSYRACGVTVREYQEQFDAARIEHARLQQDRAAL